MSKINHEKCEWITDVNSYDLLEEDLIIELDVFHYYGKWFDDEFRCLISLRKGFKDNFYNCAVWNDFYSIEELSYNPEISLLYNETDLALAKAKGYILLDYIWGKNK